jgi:DNA-binding NarL/FixJ family response regulator
MVGHGNIDSRQTRILVLTDDPGHLFSDIGRPLEAAGLSFVADARPPAEALRAIEHFAPQIVLLDLEPERIDPLWMIKNIREKFHELPMLLFSPVSEPLLASRALRAGARGYLVKSDIPGHIATAVHELLAGGRYVSERPMQGILHGMMEAEHTGGEVPVRALSDRELVIFRLLGEGQGIDQIAAELHVSAKTVVTHRYNIKRKLHLSHVCEVAKIAHNWVRSGAEVGASGNP